MKKFFIMMACWLIALIVIFAGSAIHKLNQSSDYDEAAVPYIKKVIPEISQWDPTKTKALMAPEIAATIPEENFAKAMTLFSQLGALQSIDEPKFDKVHIDQEVFDGKQTILVYETDATYENDDAMITLQLLERNGTFEVFRFNFSSKILLK